MERTKHIYDIIRRNKLTVFSTFTPRSVSKGKQQVASLNDDMQLFPRLFIGCQMRGANLQEFFRLVNQACPPALSDGRSLRLGTKSDLLTCLEDLSHAQSEAPATTSKVLDGAVIVQMLKPATVKNFDQYLSTKRQTASAPGHSVG